MKIFKFYAEVLVPKFTRAEVSLPDSAKAVHQKERSSCGSLKTISSTMNAKGLLNWKKFSVVSGYPGYVPPIRSSRKLTFNRWMLFHSVIFHTKIVYNFSVYLGLFTSKFSKYHQISKNFERSWSWLSNTASLRFLLIVVFRVIGVEKCIFRQFSSRFLKITPKYQIHRFLNWVRIWDYGN